MLAAACSMERVACAYARLQRGDSWQFGQTAAVRSVHSASATPRRSIGQGQGFRAYVRCLERKEKVEQPGAKRAKRWRKSQAHTKGYL